MSSLGFQLVYSLLGEHTDIVCERFFLPHKREPLRSLESQRPLNHFPIIFISISFEHDYLHLVQMLSQAAIPLRAADREGAISLERPLVVCGGVATFMNPEPLAPFVDLFVLGEAEPVLPDLLTMLVNHDRDLVRKDLLAAAASSLAGCYAPRFYTPVLDQGGRLSRYDVAENLPARIRTSVVSRPEVAAHSQLLTPEAEFAEMHLTELGRGCSRGCRFCAAGFIYRPPRLWDAEAVVKGLERRFDQVDRIGLLGMEMANSEALARISDYLRETGCALSFSSLRADHLNEPLIKLLAESQLKSVAIAPDGSSERLRKVINKGLQESDLLAAAERLVQAGIYKLKLYLMIGLPTETDQDLDEAIALVEKIKTRIDPIGRQRGRLTEIGISVNCFAPKPWTPFQYHPFGMSDRLPDGQTGDSRTVISELKRRQKRLRKGFTAIANVHVQFDKPDNVLFQAVLARGDRRMAGALETMAVERLNWKMAMKKHGLTPEEYAVCGAQGERFFPWYIIDHGILPDYLWQEYQKAFEGKMTAACNTTVCRRCGVCHD